MGGIGQAVEWLLEGNCVRRDEWDDDVHLFHDHEEVKAVRTGRPFEFEPNQKDMFSDDWRIYSAAHLKRKLHLTDPEIGEVRDRLCDALKLVRKWQEDCPRSPAPEHVRAHLAAILEICAVEKESK